MSRGVLLVAVVALLGLVYARRNWMRISDISEDDVRWVQGVGTNDRAVFGLIHRYLYRVRLHRFVGAAIGLVYAVVIGLMRYSTVTVGFQAVSPWADVVFCGLLGLLIGSLLAETYRVMPTLIRGSDPSITSAPRLEATLHDPLTWLLTLLTVAIALVVRTGMSAAVAFLSLLAVALYGTFLWVIRSGRRGLLPLDIRHADDAVRAFSAERFSAESLAAATLLFGWQLGLGLLADAGIWRGLSILIFSGAALALVVSTRPYPR